jgi:hypothetical protein
MEIKTANDLYKFATKACIANSMMPVEFVRLPRIVCKDGYSVSIQAGSAFYSWPREDLADEYGAFELGYQSDREPSLDEWAEPDYSTGEIDYLRCIFPFVPVEVVDAVIEKHGGIDHVG